MCKQSLRITPSRGPYVTKHIGHSIGSEFGMTSQFSNDINSSYRAILTSSDTSVSAVSSYCCTRISKCIKRYVSFPSVILNIENEMSNKAAIVRSFCYTPDARLSPLFSLPRQSLDFFRLSARFPLVGLAAILQESYLPRTVLYSSAFYCRYAIL